MPQTLPSRKWKSSTTAAEFVATSGEESKGSKHSKRIKNRSMVKSSSTHSSATESIKEAAAKKAHDVDASGSIEKSFSLSKRRPQMTAAKTTEKRVTQIPNSKALCKKRKVRLVEDSSSQPDQQETESESYASTPAQHDQMIDQNVQSNFELLIEESGCCSEESLRQQFQTK
ncbi:hypothetical protein TSUD_245870 [Trifolium subterraneum]|uniref:Uncharacterized protein n=1 Tax=Trifolium subterraneum TaxID=3900 RepID=A0A2Z6PE68_TRISU|nr:hypothetical protein TSUD_245870 [Trifolium subterraneum]